MLLLCEAAKLAGGKLCASWLHFWFMLSNSTGASVLLGNPMFPSSNAISSSFFTVTSKFFLLSLSSPFFNIFIGSSAKHLPFSLLTSFCSSPLALHIGTASLVAQLVKNPLAIQKTQVRSLGGEDPPEKEMATPSSILAGKIPWTEKPGRLQSLGVTKSWTQLSN